MAAQIGTSDLTYFLLIVVLVMLLANPIYSLIVSRVKESRLVTIFMVLYSKSFLYAFINNLYPDNYVVGVSFYIWYNVFNFFVVSVFWAKQLFVFKPTIVKSISALSVPLVLLEPG